MVKAEKREWWIYEDEGFESRFSTYNTNIRRLLVPGAGIWDLYECFRFQLLVPDADEPDNIRRQPGVCCGQYAACPVCAFTDIRHDIDDPGQTSVLRDFNA